MWDSVSSVVRRSVPSGWRGVFAVAAIAFAAIAVVHVLYTRTSRASDAATAATGLDATLNRIDRIKWEALTAGAVQPGVRRALLAEQRSAVASERQLAGRGGRLRQLAASGAGFTREVDAELRLLDHDRLAAALVADVRLERRFAGVQRAAAVAGLAAERDADEAAWLSALLGSAVLLAALGGLAAVFARDARANRRAGQAQLARTAVARSEDRLRTIVEHASDLIVVLDADGTVAMVTGAVFRMLERTPADVLGRPFAALLHRSDAAGVAELLADPPQVARRLDWRLSCGTGLRAVDVTAKQLATPGGPDQLVLTMHDVHERKAVEDELRHRASHDPLTQLANRRLFDEQLSDAIAAQAERPGIAGVLFLDLDDFKRVNDQLGHAAGDSLLEEVARRLRSCLRAGDVAARLGGDEFGVLVPSAGDEAELLALAERVRAVLGEPMAVAGERREQRPSIGVARSSGPADSCASLLRRADVAMYAAKAAGKDRCVLYHDGLADGAEAPAAHADAPPVPAFVRLSEQRREIERLLSLPAPAEPLYQPIVELSEARIVGYEALARFPGDAQRPPMAWLVQAAQVGLREVLEAAVIRAVLATPGRPVGTFLSLNVGPAMLLSPALDEVLPDDLGGIVLELSEHELVGDGDRVAAGLDRLRARGAQVALDDIGAGYAGLRQLLVVRPDILKLDPTLTCGIATDRGRQAIAEAAVALAERTGARVCAEGLEQHADAEVCARLGIALGQGFVFARAARPWATTAGYVTMTPRRRLAA